MTALRIHRFVLPVEAVVGTCVDEEIFPGFEVLLDLFLREDTLQRITNLKVALFRGRNLFCYGKPRFDPGFEPAIQYTDITVAGRAEREPEAGREIRFAPVIENHEGVLPDPEIPHLFRERFEIRERVTAVCAGLHTRDIRLHIREHRARDVRFEIRLAPLLRVNKVRSHINDHDVVPAVLKHTLEARRGDERKSRLFHDASFIQKSLNLSYLFL